VADAERVYLTGHDNEYKRFSVKAIRLVDGALVCKWVGEMGGELALAGGRLFQVANEGAQAFEAGSGTVLWRRSPGWRYAQGLLADSERVYVVGQNAARQPTVYAIAAGDGQSQWASILPFCRSYDHSFAMKPGILFIGVDKDIDKDLIGGRAAVVALRPEDGCRLWEWEAPGVADLGSVPPESLGGLTLTSEGLLVLAALRYYWWRSYSQMMVYDLEKERLLWKKRLRFTAGVAVTTEGGIATDGARAFFSTTYNGAEVRCLDLRTGWPLWQSSFNTTNASHPVVSNIVVLVASAEGDVMALATKNGRMMWKICLQGYHAPYIAREQWRRLLVAGGRIIVFDDHTVWAIKAMVRPSAPSGE
jgi:outer membrane protein assembly factor BamB